MRRTVRRPVGVYLAMAALFAAPAAGIASERHSGNDALFSAEQYVGWIDHLASDDLEGRGTGQEGIDKAADYVSSIWESFGVAPAGDDNSFFQNFELALSKKIGDGTRLAIGTQGRLTRKPAELDADYVPLPFSADGSFSGDVVFAGYGIANKADDYDDYAGIDVEGKVVLILRRGPDFGSFGMRDISFRAKSLTAKDHGATALLIVNRDEDASLYEFGRGGGRGGDHGLPMLHVTPAFANRMLAAGGLQDIKTLQDRIERTQAPASAALEGVSARGRVEIEPVYSDVRNVVGMIPGTGPQKDEIIVLGAHYDHLGIRNKDKADFDPSKDISNGADDNASGTAMLMQFAKAYTQGEAPNRTLVLVAFTGEELGLLGSAHFAKDPTVDLDKCIAMLNFDMVGRLKDDMLEVGGMRTGGFEAMIDDLAQPYGFDIRDGGGGRGPSDHTNFYLREIPVLFFFTGLHKQYHRPEDDTPLINPEGAMRIARFACDVIDSIDGNATPPTFAKDSRRANIGRQKERDATPKSDAPGEPPMAGPGGTPNDEPVRLGIVPMPTRDGSGLLVEEVSEGTPAAKAGLRPGDRITQIGEQKIHAIEDAVAAMARLRLGDTAKVHIVRSGTAMALDVQFGDAPKPHHPKKQQTAHRQSPHAGKSSETSANAAIVECLMAIIKSHDEITSARSVSMTSTPQRVELEAIVACTVSNLSEWGALTDKVNQTIEQFPHKNGLPYRFDYAIKSQFGNSGDLQLVTISIGVDRETDGASGHGRAAANPHGSPHGSPHSAAPVSNPHGNPHGAPASGNPHANPHISGRPRSNPHGDAHGDEPADDVENNRMPPVRLGIMPNYGENDGEGWEIAGVVEGGAAEKAGMRDNDRILSIGGRDVTDVYTYMDALRNCKPGEKIKVVVLRDGKRVELTIVTAAPKVEEAA